MKRKSKEDGFTYAELVICLVIIAIVVGPICMSFASANRVRATSEALNDSITYTEALMEGIKEQLTEDIKFKKQKEGNQILNYPATPSVGTGIKLCLEDKYTAANPLETKKLEEFLVHTDDAARESLYGTDRYAYEVAVWRADNIDLAAISGTNTLEFKGSTLDRAAKFYSNNSYDLSSYATSSANIKFEIDDSMFKKVFKKQADAPIGACSVLDQYMITLTPGNLKYAIDFTNTDGLKGEFVKGNLININAPVLVQGVPGTIDSLIYTCTTTGNIAGAINIIDVDVRGLFRKEDLGGKLATDDTYKGLTLKFINDTNQDQIIRLIRNASQGIDTLEDVDAKINVVALDRKSGKTSVQRVEETAYAQSFIIAIVARDMKPAMGKPGKVVKKMIDVYSYETGNN